MWRAAPTHITCRHTYMFYKGNADKHTDKQICVLLLLSFCKNNRYTVRLFLKENVLVRGKERETHTCIQLDDISIFNTGISTWVNNNIKSRPRLLDPFRTDVDNMNKSFKKYSSAEVLFSPRSLLI